MIICILLGHFICPKGVPLPPPPCVFMCVSAGTCILWCLCADQRAISGVYPCLPPCLTQLAVLRVRGGICLLLYLSHRSARITDMCTPLLKCGIRTHRFVWQALYALNRLPSYSKALFQNPGPAVPPAGLLPPCPCSHSSHTFNYWLSVSTVGCFVLQGDGLLTEDGATVIFLFYPVQLPL